MSSPFVILEHFRRDAVTPDHWDLMFGDPAGPLATWSLTRPPNVPGQHAARRLAPHRTVYLRYEGPISGDRGWIRRWDRGRCEILAETPNLVRLFLHGERWGGMLTLERRPATDADWTARFQRIVGARPAIGGLRKLRPEIAKRAVLVSTRRSTRSR